MQYTSLLLALVVLACQHPVEIPPVPVVPRAIDEKPDDISRVCNHLRSMQCEAGAPTPEGATCEEVITNAATQGIDLAGDVQCVEASTSCEAADKCE